MKTTIYENVRAEGELGYRLSKSFARMQDAEYRPEVIFSIEKNGWAGDWEGRTILALTLLSRATGQKAAYLDAILARLREELNERGYLKEILPDGMADEQQLSGHNWLLRGLIEHTLWTGDAQSAAMAKRIVETLYLPTLPLFASYPSAPEVRSMNGAASGHIDGRIVGGWRLSTDIGCAFMAMDALSQYVAVYGDERVLRLLEAMYDALSAIDFQGASMQTHASLSACRGVLRLYQLTRREDCLAFAVRFFALYQARGMTENYANFNWFGRPLWTEPCAVVDSYLLAIELWKETKQIQYLRVAHRIFHNAIAHGQRSNGGFGCDDCAGPGGRFLRAQEKHYEAYWCCTMRGAEGLAKAALNAVLEEEERILLIGGFSGEFRFADVRLKVCSRLPLEGSVTVDIERNEGRKVLCFYVPEGAAASSVHLTVRGEEVAPVWQDGLVTAAVVGCGQVCLRFAIALQQRATVSEETPAHLRTYWHGDVLLGVRTNMPVQVNPDQLAPVGTARYSDGATLLEPAADSIALSKEALLQHQMQVLFD